MALRNTASQLTASEKEHIASMKRWEDNQKLLISQIKLTQVNAAECIKMYQQIEKASTEGVVSETAYLARIVLQHKDWFKVNNISSTIKI